MHISGRYDGYPDAIDSRLGLWVLGHACVLLFLLIHSSDLNYIYTMSVILWNLINSVVYMINRSKRMESQQISE